VRIVEPATRQREPLTRSQADNIAIDGQWIGAEAELVDQGQHAVLRHRDELAATVVSNAARSGHPEETAANARLGLDHGDRRAGRLQARCRGQAGDAGTDDGNVYLTTLHRVHPSGNTPRGPAVT
jgi:hypothetical protein